MKESIAQGSERFKDGPRLRECEGREIRNTGKERERKGNGKVKVKQFSKEGRKEITERRERKDR